MEPLHAPRFSKAPSKPANPKTATITAVILVYHPEAVNTAFFRFGAVSPTQNAEAAALSNWYSAEDKLGIDREPDPV